MHDQGDLIKYAKYHNINFENFNGIKNVEGRKPEDWGKLYLNIANNLKIDGTEEIQKIIVENELNEYFNHTCFGTIRTVGNFPYQAEFEPDTFDLINKTPIKIDERKKSGHAKGLLSPLGGTKGKVTLNVNDVLNVGNDGDTDKMSDEEKENTEKRFTYFLDLLRRQNQTQTTSIYEGRFHVRQLLWALNGLKEKKDRRMQIAHKTEECKMFELSLFVPKSGTTLRYGYEKHIHRKLVPIFKMLEDRNIKYKREEATLDNWVTHESQWRDILSVQNEINGSNITIWEHHPRHDILQSFAEKLKLDVKQIRDSLRHYFNSDEGELICLYHKQIEKKRISWKEKFTFKVKYVEKMEEKEKDKPKVPVFGYKKFTETIILEREELRPIKNENLEKVSTKMINSKGLKIIQMSRTNGSKGLCHGKFLLNTDYYYSGAFFCTNIDIFHN